MVAVEDWKGKSSEGNGNRARSAYVLIVCWESGSVEQVDQRDRMLPGSRASMPAEPAVQRVTRQSLITRWIWLWERKV